MDIKSKLMGATLAAAIGVTFIASPFTSALAQVKEMPCYGVNSCRGQSDCKSYHHACKGKNACKGRGYVMKTPKDCRAMGGKFKQPSSSTSIGKTGQ